MQKQYAGGEAFEYSERITLGKVGCGCVSLGGRCLVSGSPLDGELGIGLRARKDSGCAEHTLFTALCMKCKQFIIDHCCWRSGPEQTHFCSSYKLDLPRKAFLAGHIQLRGSLG